MKSSLKSFLLATAVIVPSVAFCQSPTEGEEIDLGLSVNWRAYNLGADSPGGIGDVYAYAVTKAGTYSSMYEYPFFNQMKFSVVLPEGSIAGNESYDAATAVTNGRWHMATKEQWEELLNGCDIVASSCDGTNGYLLTSKTNGNSIFLPTHSAYGYPRCYYYTAESNGTNPYWAMVSNSSSVELMTSNFSTGPWTGLPLRAVCERPTGPALEAITVTAAATEIFAGTTTVVTAAAVPEDAQMYPVYSSSDESVATVTDKGVVETIAGGKVTITATSGSVSGSVEITVTAVETAADEEVVDLGLSVDWLAWNEGASARLEAGTAYPFAYVTPDELDNAFSYRFYNGSYKFPLDNFCGNVAYDAIAKNAAEGSGRRLPSALECAELLEKCHAMIVNVDGTDCVRLTSTVNGKHILFSLGSYYTGSTNVEKTKALALLFSVSDGVLTVKTDNYASPYAGRPLRGVIEHATAPDLAEIQLNVAEASVFVENTVQLSALPMPYGAVFSALEWSSDDESVATVSDAGLVTGTGAGTAVITATDGGIKASAIITVKAVDLGDGATVNMGTEVLWSTRELGAESPTENGRLYFWGMTDPIVDSEAGADSWVYPSEDRYIAGTEYDAVTRELGENWHIPTQRDVLDLIENADFEWITCGGRYGALITSKVTGAMMFCPMPKGRKCIFYYCDIITFNSTSEGYPTSEGLYIENRRFDISGERPWTALPLRPVYENTSLGVDTTDADGDAVVTGVYTVDGRFAGESVSGLRDGLYIVRYADGSCRKITKK